MYEDFFGLTEKPFSIQPDPSFLYWGRSHRLAYAMLEYGVLNQAGISVITGEVGCGKTTLIHRLLDQLSDTHSVALLSNIQAGRGDLLSWVLMGFGQPFAGKSHVELFSQLQDFFIGEYAKGRRVILIIDEAQNLGADVLEELRMLSNINAGKDQLLQLILVGQPQLKDLLNRPDMLQLAQRIGSDFHLTALSREEIGAYIETRLAIAGARQRIFTEPAVGMIAEHSRGVPRVINIIADTALVYAFSAQETSVGVDTVSNVVRDKIEFGVFGIATRRDGAAPVAPAGEGPSAFVREAPSEPAAGRGARGRAEPAPAPSSPPASQPASPPVSTPHPRAPEVSEPRMPAVRRRSLAHSQPSAQTFVGALARSESAPNPTPAPVRFEPKRSVFDGSAFSPAPAAPKLHAVPAEAADPARPAGEAGAASAKPGPDAPFSEVGVVVAGGGSAIETTIRAAGDEGPVIYVAQAADQEIAAAAGRAGAEALMIADRALSPGRARNAGYRELKKQRPNLRYVQFVEAGFVLDPAWLAAARRFMDRRPEVAVIEGWASSPARRPAGATESGEVEITGPTAFVRASAFESAGGFRGDLIVNETADLCIRLRRRGAHIWRLDAPMGVRGLAPAKTRDWWARAARRGFDYAHGADLHGAPPEELYSAEQWRAILWGAIVPLLMIVIAVGGAGLAAWLAPFVGPVAVMGGVFGLGGVLYLMKIIVTAFRYGALDVASWAAACEETLAHVPEVFGVWRFHFGGARVKAAVRGLA